MCEIKFRAWEKTLKEMIPVRNIDFEKKMINTESAWRFIDEIELMQYTGLKDKNEKEVYEGDIVKLTDYHGERIVKVAFYNGVYYYTGDGFSDEYIFNSRDREIIGNIYENPELAEGHQSTE